LDYGFGWEDAVARAALFVEEAENFGERGGVGFVPEEGAGAADIDEADVAEFFEVMGKSGAGDAEFVLEFAGVHASGVRGEEEANDLQAGFGAEGGEAVGAAGDEEGIWRLGHISIIAEIWMEGKGLFPCVGSTRVLRR
jgi:hypothetical protein